MNEMIDNFAIGLTWAGATMLVIIALLLLYVVFRIVSLAIFTSWWQSKARLYKHLFKKRGNTNIKGGHNHANQN
jgi:hypothetical protein